MGKGLAIASMILGICSVMFCLAGFLPLGAGIVAIIMAGVVLKKGEKDSGKGFAITGLVTGIIGILCSAIYTLLWSVLFSVI